MSYHRGISGFQSFLFVITLDALHVYGKDCYNYKEEPKVRDCSQGCCGEEYEQYCCDATMQIVGCVLGGLLLIGAIIGVAYFCYRSKSKQGGLVAVPAVLGRLGMRSNINQNPAQARQTTRRPQRLPLGRNTQQVNSSYDPTYVNSVQMQCSQPPGYYPPTFGNDMHSMALQPTAPMPPPYEMTVAPPPYALSKSVPPPPAYNSVVSHMATPGYKAGGYRDNMPDPAD